MPKGIVRRVSGVDIEVYGEDKNRLIFAQTVYQDYVRRHHDKLDKNSLKKPPFVTKEGNDPSKQTFLIFIPSDKEGSFLKALHEVGAASQMWSGFDTEDATMFLVDEPDVAERAAKNIGITIGPADYVTVVFVDAGLPEPKEDPQLLDGRGVGEMLVFAIGFNGFLKENGFEIQGDSGLDVEALPVPPEERVKYQESCREALAFANLWSNEVLRGGTNAE
ncbi:MAG: hypothetical protein SPL61_11105 [Saccharofermentans sp.]|nr:hypothetical protein [Saccharofermentans sp.]